MAMNYIDQYKLWCEKAVGDKDVMDELKAVDDVAYVRFASVYRQFKDVGTFIEFLKKI